MGDLRTLNASHKTLSDQLKQTAAEKDQSEQVIANFENELNDERAHVAKMRNNMIQLKELLQSTVLSRWAAQPALCSVCALSLLCALCVLSLTHSLSPVLVLVVMM